MDFGFCGEPWDQFPMANKKETITLLSWCHPDPLVISLRQSPCSGCRCLTWASHQHSAKLNWDREGGGIHASPSRKLLISLVDEASALWREASWHSLFLPELVSSLEVGVNMAYSQLHMQPLVLRSLVGFLLYWRVGEGWRKNTQVCRESKGKFCRGYGVWAETWRKDKGIHLRLPRTQGYRWSSLGRTWAPKSDASSWEGCALKGYCEDEKYQVQNACHHTLQMTTIAALFKPDHCRRLWDFALRLPEHHCYNPWHYVPSLPHSAARCAFFELPLIRISSLIIVT